MSTSRTSAELIIPTGAEFGVELKYEPHSQASSRVFRSMTSLIESFEEIDRDLVRSINGRIEPVLLLEDIQAGSLLTWLRSALESVDEEALKGLEWKKFVGAYLVKGKRVLIDYLNQRTSITLAEEISELQGMLIEAAEETDVLRIPTYQPIPQARIANSIRLLAQSVTPLASGDSAKYLSDAGSTDINISFNIVPESLEDVLTRETIQNEDAMILRIKKPDFLGESMWDFRFEGRTITAKMADLAWLSAFRRRAVELRPGDGIRAMVRSTVKYGYDGDVVAAHYEVLRVLGVVRVESPRQDNLI